MKTTTKNSGQASAPKNFGGKFLGLLILAAILIGLFWRSFLPDYIHFSNDGPLGLQNATWLQLPKAITGQWSDLNTIGINGGAASLDLTTLIHWSLGAVDYAKFLVPIALLFLGLGAWTFFRILKLSPLAVTLGTLATALNSVFVAGACWSVASVEIALGFNFFALALIVANKNETPWHICLIRLILAGMCVGINVMEAADVGALCSVFIAGFIFLKSIADTDSSVAKKTGRGILHVAICAICAGFIATQAISSLVGSQISGIAGTAQDKQTKAARWDFATQWSLPKKETLGMFVPGLFGYRADTPQDMLPALQNAYRGGEYWGGMGRSPEIDRFFDSGQEGNPPAGMMRFGFGGYYCGLLVILVALLAATQSFRRINCPFNQSEKKSIWFWTAVIAISLLLSWGRFAPFFYGALYQLPYFSTIRNPAKFLFFTTWAITILFAYGIHAISRLYLIPSVKPANELSVQIKNWWRNVGSFDRKWTYALTGIFAASIFGWIIFDSEKANFISYLQKVGFPEEDAATSIANFSLGQVGWFVILLLIASTLLLVTHSGFFSGSRTKLGGFLLGAFIVFDLGRANLPWVIHWDYKQKYEIGSLNPVVNFLRDQPYEHRVAILPFQTQQQLRPYDNFFSGSGLYTIEWAQHLFLYNDIQSLDVVQMPRKPADLEAFDTVMAFGSPLRHWELTNTRYLLGPAGFIEPLNEQLDPLKHRFSIALRFDLAPKAGVTQLTELSQFTAVTNADGDLALFDFSGALPRAKLYSNWQIAKTDPAILRSWLENIQKYVPAEMGNTLASLGTNDLAMLHMLVDTNFDPATTVLIPSSATNLPAVTTKENHGTVTFKDYSPRRITLNATATAPSILLLNDKYDPHWSVTVDGQPVELLRCNFLMRGVFLTPGEHTVEFQFNLPNKPLYITIAAISAGILLSALLVFLTRKQQNPAAK